MNLAQGGNIRIDLVREYSGYNASNIAITGGYAYLVSVGGALHVLDVTDPARATLVGTYQMDSFPSAIDVADDYAYVLDSEGLQIIDMSDLGVPRLIATYEINHGSAGSIKLSNGYAYISALYNGLYILDVRNPKHPILAAHYDPVGWVREITLVSTDAYVVSNGLEILDVSDASDPVLIGRYQGSGIDLSVNSGYVYLTNGGYSTYGIEVIDVAELNDPKWVASHYIPGDEWDIVVESNKAYVAAGYAGVKVYDIGNGTELLSIASYDTRGEARELVRSGDYIYVADVGSLVVLELVDLDKDSDGDGTADALDLDDDNDGMPDAFEIANGFDPFDDTDAVLDADGDGLVNLAEHDCGTDPLQDDSDGDGHLDGDDSDPLDRMSPLPQEALPTRGGWRAILR